MEGITSVKGNSRYVYGSGGVRQVPTMCLPRPTKIDGVIPAKKRQQFRQPYLTHDAEAHAATIDVRVKSLPNVAIHSSTIHTPTNLVLLI